MPSKSSTTIEVPTKLIKALMRSDAMELSIVNAKQTASVTDGPLQREWQAVAEQLSELSNLLFVKAGEAMGHSGEWCDSCGDEITEETRIVVPSLSQDITSANAGESAVLCLVCHMKVGAA